MKPVSEMTREEARGLRYVLMDIDDTITREGKLLASSYDALWKLKEAGLRVIPVTGRPAGWCDLIAREWPVDGVVGENGALAFWEEPAAPGLRGAGGLPVLRTEFHPDAVKNDHPVLARVRDRALGEFPGLRIAKDQFARLFDLALDFAEEDPVLPLSAAERVRDIALEEGAMAKVSSIHVNIWMGSYDKLSMVERFLHRRFGWRAGPESGDRELVFVGDSPNDEPMFARFPLSCAVANIRRYGDLITHFPAFAASKECGEGFAEIAAVILEKRR
ncbi:MAG: HAD hydrolase family protein [Treponema sp.]|jgi:hydroxymethylpyrimidine pyrophosphatase-like HAD family hydrolase|nr:HAD hydrolase family protein [Treponema sp.]